MRTKKNAKLVIGFDLDGVIIDHSKNKDFITRKLGFSFKKSELASDILLTRLPIDISRQVQGFLYGHPKIALRPEIFEGIFDVLKLLKRKGVQYFLVSRRRNEKMAIKLLKKNKLWPHFFNSRNAFFVEKIAGKHEKAAELKISHYIDDQPSVLKELKSVENRFLFDPHDSHRHSRHHKKISSWKMFLEELNDMI